MRKGLYIAVIFIGFLQSIGYLTGLKPIRDLGIITSASPLPIVFTEVKGVETFASDFYVQWTNKNKQIEQLKITPAMYSMLKGPYNRRNIYGAAIAYGPVLPNKLLQPILEYSLCQNILRDELGIPYTGDSISILIKTRTKNRADQWILEASCKK